MHFLCPSVVSPKCIAKGTNIGAHTTRICTKLQRERENKQDNDTADRKNLGGLKTK